MEYVKSKVHDETNYYNGVDLNNKEAVQKEFQKRRATHTFFTLIFINKYKLKHNIRIINNTFFRLIIFKHN